MRKAVFTDFWLRLSQFGKCQTRTRRKKISYETWYQILDAKILGKTPPQNTQLGGHIGIHGIGQGNPAIHNNYNWTNGCIALTNKQIDQLSQWVKTGTVVNIR